MTHESGPTCAAANPAIALRLQSTRPAGRVAELRSLGAFSEFPTLRPTSRSGNRSSPSLQREALQPQQFPDSLIARLSPQ